MKKLLSAVLITGVLATGCGNAPKSVVPGSKCYKSQKGVEVVNPDGTEYECKKKGLFGKRYTWQKD